MIQNEILEYTRKVFEKEGADKYQCSIVRTKKQELTVDMGMMRMLRTTLDDSLRLLMIKENRKAQIIINKTDKKSIDDAVMTLNELLQTAEVDKAYDISPKQEAKTFKLGKEEADIKELCDFVKEFTTNLKEKYPLIKYQFNFSFDYKQELFVNSNGVEFIEKNGAYNFDILFMANDGVKTTSFNGTEGSMRELKGKLLDFALVEDGLKQSIKELNAKAFEGKFVGDVLIIPECFDDLLTQLAQVSLEDNSLISNTSVFRDKIGEEVFSPLFTWYTNPVSEEICDGSAITIDGFETKNMSIVENGILKNYMLTQYGANKTGLKRSESYGGSFEVEAGDKTYEEMIKGIDKGILLCRFSGGRISPSGDFSGIAKNSFYIENGKIKYPITETMISANFIDMLKNIKTISKERVNLGYSIMPWVLATGATISGK